MPHAHRSTNKTNHRLPDVLYSWLTTDRVHTIFLSFLSLLNWHLQAEPDSDRHFLDQCTIQISPSSLCCWQIIILTEGNLEISLTLDQSACENNLASLMEDLSIPYSQTQLKTFLFWKRASWHHQVAISWPFLEAAASHYKFSCFPRHKTSIAGPSNLLARIILLKFSKHGLVYLNSSNEIGMQNKSRAQHKWIII